LARRHGATDEELENLGDLERCPLSEAERAAVRFAEKMTLAAGDMDAADVEELLKHWDPGEAVEIACTAGVFNYLNRFAEAFGLWPTRPGEGGPDDPFAGDGSDPAGERGARP
jgi:alkylhydroperoxidase family enzyme